MVNQFFSIKIQPFYLLKVIRKIKNKRTFGNECFTQVITIAWMVSKFEILCCL